MVILEEVYSSRESGEEAKLFLQEVVQGLRSSLKKVVRFG